MKKLLPLILILTVVFLLAVFIFTGVQNKEDDNEQTTVDTSTSTLPSGVLLIPEPDTQLTGDLCSSDPDSMLTISELKSLVARYGRKLSWCHFQQFYGIDETTEGYELITYTYPIYGDMYKLTIFGSDPYSGTAPHHIDLVKLSTNIVLDIRYCSPKDLDALVDITPGRWPATMPEDFSFSLTWGYNGYYQYDSLSGRFTKTMTSGDNYIAYQRLEKSALEQVYNWISDIDPFSYPDIYDPQNGSAPQTMTLILTVHINGEEKTVKAENIPMNVISKDPKGRQFLNVCGYIKGSLSNTEAYRSLPKDSYDDYEEVTVH